MKHLFIPYSLAVIAKEKGFDEHCLATWFIGKVGDKDYSKTPKFGYSPYLDDEDVEYCNNKYKDSVAAPLYQQIVDWFREKHNIEIYVQPRYFQKKYYMGFIIPSDYTCPK